MMATPFVYIWRYAVRAGMKEDFLKAYCQDGEWAQLFSTDPSYIRTDLLKSSDDADVYMTVDYWTSRDARDAFREKHRVAFDALDRKCEAYTKRETLIGDFIVMGNYM